MPFADCTVYNTAKSWDGVRYPDGLLGTVQRFGDDGKPFVEWDNGKASSALRMWSEVAEIVVCTHPILVCEGS